MENNTHTHQNEHINVDKCINKYMAAQVNYDQIVQAERGWQGHFICACGFHLNTLLDLDGFKVVVSTVGAFIPPHSLEKEGHRYDTIGYHRFYETMAFESLYDSYDDANVSNQVYFDSEWAYDSESDVEPQAGHWVVVEEIKRLMASGSLSKESFKKSDDED